MSEADAYAPTQAAEFSGPGKHAIVLYTPDWSAQVLEVLRRKPGAYEADWRFQTDRRAHVLRVAYEDGLTLHIAFIDGVHNALLARLARGCALVLSPYPLYRNHADEKVDKLFTPDESLALPQLPSPLALPEG